MSPLARLSAEGTVALLALVEALLGAHLLVKYGLASVPGSWPAPLTKAAELLLWPLTLPFGQAPAELSAGVVALAMMVYLALACALLGAMRVMRET